MARLPKRIPHPDARVGGYLRVSNVHFPPDCRTPEQRTDFVDGMRRVRMAELAADAAGHGDEIAVWYDDMGVSGRGEFLARRTDFERLRLDARQGRVRAVYARDLSRLFRDVVQQELWFNEMKDCGVRVQAQDLPFATDPATQRLLRQQMGSIHEYMAERQGAVVRAVLEQKVLSGQWVGRTRSVWGLTYDPAAKAFAPDPATADHARVVFETFVACGGVGGRTARRLNQMVREGEPRATRTPWGSEWNTALVFVQVRNPLYRRRTVYGQVDMDAPDRIPQVLPPGLVAEADRLLAERAPIFAACSTPARQRPTPFTYTGLARCARCGWALSPVRSRGEDGRQAGRWVAWTCAAPPQKTGCDSQFSVRQARLDALVARALAVALAPPGGEYREETRVRLGEPRMDSDPALLVPSLESKLLHLSRRRDRYLEMCAAGLLTDQALLQQRLETLAREEAYLRGRIAEVHAALAGRPPRGREEARRLARARLAALWGDTPEAVATLPPVLDEGRRAFLQELGAVLRILIHPREARERRPGNLHRYGGLVTLTLEAPALGLTGQRVVTVTETQEEASRCRSAAARGLCGSSGAKGGDAGGAA
jgi:DNA invertase Pin-like site-specific DNA recombinase